MHVSRDHATQHRKVFRSATMIDIRELGRFHWSLPAARRFSPFAGVTHRLKEEPIHMNNHRFPAAFLLIGLASICWLTATSGARGESPTIDGVFSDWHQRHVVASDDEGDASGSFDVTKLAAVKNRTRRPCRHAAKPNPVARCVFPVPGLPIKHVLKR